MIDWIMWRNTSTLSLAAHPAAACVASAAAVAVEPLAPALVVDAAAVNLSFRATVHRHALVEQPPCTQRYQACHATTIAGKAAAVAAAAAVSEALMALHQWHRPLAAAPTARRHRKRLWAAAAKARVVAAQAACGRWAVQGQAPTCRPQPPPSSHHSPLTSSSAWHAWHLCSITRCAKSASGSWWPWKSWKALMIQSQLATVYVAHAPASTAPIVAVVTCPRVRCSCGWLITWDRGTILGNEGSNRTTATPPRRNIQPWNRATGMCDTQGLDSKATLSVIERVCPFLMLRSLACGPRSALCTSARVRPPAALTLSVPALH
jgi:hypothetical protein